MADAIAGTLKHAKFLAKHLGHCDYSTVVIVILYELGFAPKNDGFHCLKKAIVMRCENPARQFKNDIYIEVSLQLDGTEDNDRVEQSIRRAISDAWKRRDEKVWRRFFYTVGKEKLSKPSNGDFIATLAWFVELWQGCCKEVEYASR